MMKNRVFLVNGKSNRVDLAIKFLKSNGIDYNNIASGKEMIRFIKEKLNEGKREFILCGGDGTINYFVNSLLKLPNKIRKKVIIGIIPCGRANDLALELGIPIDVKKAFSIVNVGRRKKIDLVKVNDYFIITGGGFGLPAEVIDNMNRYKKVNKFLSKMLKDAVYYLYVLKLAILGYSGVEINGKQFMAICVLNQGSIGKRFNIFPNSKNDDGILEVCFIDKPKGIINTLKTILKIKNGKFFNDNKKNVEIIKKIKLELDSPNSFMGDGEILSSENTFNIQILPKSLTLMY